MFALRRAIFVAVVTFGGMIPSGAQAAEYRLHLDSAPGDYIGAGIDQTFGSVGGAFSGHFDSAAHISFTAPDFSHWWFLDFAAPYFLPPFTGTYVGATRYPFENPTAPGLSIYGDGRGCNEDFGSFVVLEANYTLGGAIHSFAADFEQHCESPSAPALIGEVRFNSCVDEPDGTPCDGGNLCRANFTCQGGQCTGTDTVCPPADQCHAAGTCNPGTGLCSNPLKPNGSVCDAGTAVTCSQADTCQAGVCVGGGGGDADGDLVCDLDDPCPAVPDPAQADLDGDGVGDRCDDEDGLLMMSSLRLKRSHGTAPTGTARARGSMLLAAPGDVFSTDAGLTVSLTAGGVAQATASWSAADCSIGSANITCVSPDGNSRARFQTLQGVSTLYSIKIRLRGLALVPPLVGPLELRLTHGNQVDRVGVLDTCLVSDSGVRCRLF